MNKYYSLKNPKVCYKYIFIPFMVLNLQVFSTPKEEYSWGTWVAQ